MSVKQASSSLLLSSSSTTGYCGSIQDLPIELIRKILYEFILSSPHSEDKEKARGCYKMSFQYCYGKMTLRAFLISSKRVFHQWGRVLNYINLDIDHTTRYARDESFRHHVRSLVEDPKRQLGLHLRLPKSRVVEEDNAFIAKCNHVHHIYHDTKLEQHQYTLLNDVAILMGNSSLFVEDISVFTNNNDIVIGSPSIQCIDNSFSLRFGNLEYLTIYHANNLTRIEGGLPRLRYLHLNTAYHFVELSGVPTLEHLELHYLNKLTTIRDIGNLKEVRISSSDSFTAIEQFCNIPTVSLSLAHVKDISSLTNVRELAVVGCAEIGWHALQENCEKLSIYYNSLKSLEGLTFKKLRYLKLEGCREFESLSNVNHVKEIHLKGCQVRDISPVAVENGGKVEKIYIESCPVQDLRPLKGIKDVTVIGFNVNQFKSLGHHTRLTLSGYYKASSFPKFENVKHLSIASCDKFSKVDTTNYNSYYGLKFYNCRALKSISSLPNLVELVLDNMYGMTEFNSIGFPSLQRLEIISCTSMKKIILPHLLEHFAYERSEGKAVEIKLKSKMQHIEVSGLPALVTISYFEK
eukprot:gene6061-6516_t